MKDYSFCRGKIHQWVRLAYLVFVNARREDSPGHYIQIEDVEHTVRCGS